MSHPVTVADPFALTLEDVATEQQQLRLAVEEATIAAVLPFENEKQLVNRDHNDWQKTLWGERDDHKYPVEILTTGA